MTVIMRMKTKERKEKMETVCRRTRKKADYRKRLKRTKRVEMEEVIKKVKRKIIRKKKVNIRKEKMLMVIVQVNGVNLIMITETLTKITAITI